MILEQPSNSDLKNASLSFFLGGSDDFNDNPNEKREFIPEISLGILFLVGNQLNTHAFFLMFLLGERVQQDNTTKGVPAVEMLANNSLLGKKDSEM